MSTVLTTMTKITQYRWEKVLFQQQVVVMTIIRHHRSPLSILIYSFSPRAWLEYYPDGVYTVLRVELYYGGQQQPQATTNTTNTTKTTNNNVVNVKNWGMNFHLDRLEHPYRKWWYNHLQNKNNDDIVAADTKKDDEDHGSFCFRAAR